MKSNLWWNVKLESKESKNIKKDKRQKNKTRQHQIKFQFCLIKTRYIHLECFLIFEIEQGFISKLEKPQGNVVSDRSIILLKISSKAFTIRN